MKVYKKSTTGHSGFQKMTTAQFQKRLDDVRGKEYKLLGEYIGTAIMHHFRHICGLEFEARPDTMIRVGGRRKCPCQQKSLRCWVPQIYQQRLAEKGLFELVELGKSKSKLKHPECGKTFKVETNYGLILKHCPCCQSRMHTKIENNKIKFLQALQDKFQGDYQLIGDYTSNIQDTLFQHKCGHQFEARPYDLLKKIGRHRCYKCYPKGQAVRKNIIIAGRQFRLMGYEPLVLGKLVAKYGVKNVVAEPNPVPTFRYKFQGKWRTYTPDFYIPSSNLIIEVKSTATLGLETNRFGKSLLELTRAKRKKVLKSGYRFRVIVFDRRENQLKLPKDWYNMTREELADILGIKIYS